jgi:sigma-B regulation protein RsbU (phosphoserine phosphatase)
MNLRVRITLIVLVSFVAFTGLVVIEGQTREAAIERRLERTILSGLRTGWIGVAEAEHQRFLRHLAQTRSNRSATRAFAAQDAEALSRAIVTTRTQLSTANRQTGLQALRPDGSPFLSADGDGAEAGGVPILPPEIARAVVTQGQRVDGLFRSVAGGLVYALAAPIYDRDGVSGLLLLHTAADALVADLGDLLGTRSVLVGPDGNLEMSVDPVTASLLARFVETDAKNGDRAGTITTDASHFQLVQMPLTGPEGETGLGWLVSLRDVSEIAQHQARISQLSFFALACALVLFLATVNWYLRRSFRPLTAVVRSLNALSQGDTGVAVRVPARDDEIGRLADSFETFRQGIEARAQLSRLQQELDLAADIQRQSLPAEFPSGDRLTFAARMQAAREVGGDFYDVFALPDGRVACVIADVSGKGMGAALFMAVSRTVLRTMASLTPDPGECLRRANARLVAENASLLFVTVFYAVVDPRSGQVVYGNAGHNPPVLVNRHAGVRSLEMAASPPLGIDEWVEYATRTLTMEPGERLFLYTDGITEAMTHDLEEFGETRLFAALLGADGGPDKSGTASGGSGETEDAAERLVHQVLSAVATFTGNTAQHDDITCLVVSYEGGSKSAANS